MSDLDKVKLLTIAAIVATAANAIMILVAVGLIIEAALR